MKLQLLILSLLPMTVFANGYTWMGDLSHHVHLSESVLTFGLVCVLLLLVGLTYRIIVGKNTNPIIPDKGLTFRNAIEGLGQLMYNLCVSVMGEEQTKKYYSAIIMVFLLVFFSNIIGLVPGFLPPTENLNVTLALGVFAFVYYNIEGIRAQGLWGHIKHFMGPVWYMAFLIFPIEIISHVVRPVSLALRLRGNMYGDHLVLGAFSELVPIGVPVVFMFLGLFVSFIQAFVFSLLTMVYIAMATEVHHDHDEDHAHH